MADRQDLEKRVAELESELARLRGRGYRGIRYRSSFALGDVPLLVIASGPDPETGALRGHAKGVIAIGDVATGVIALGGLARGVVAFGGLALGAISFGGLSIGALLAVGGLALGGAAFGGGAVGGAAIGGGAAGYYACGGGAIGEHVIRPGHVDAEAEAFFSRYGLEGFCRGQSRPMPPEAVR
jgi:hypothetical protein